MSAGVAKKRENSFVYYDSLSPDRRALVQDFGLPIIRACEKAGVTDPARIRELVIEIWAGPRQGNARALTSQGGDAYSTIDWLLLQSGSNLSVRSLSRVLAQRSITILSTNPTRAMIDASMREVSGFTVRCTKEEKHIRRLRAALRAGMAETLEGRKS